MLFILGEGQNENQENTYTDEETTYKISNSDFNSINPSKTNLKLVMNPHGKVQDLKSLTKQGEVIQPALSPALCFDLVKDLTTTKGKGKSIKIGVRKGMSKECDMRTSCFIIPRLGVRQVIILENLGPRLCARFFF